MITLLIWILLVTLLLYLGIGLGIYFIGTREPGSQGKSLVRFTEQRLVFKDENVKVNLQASKIEMPVKEEKKEPWNVVLVIDKSDSMSWRSAIAHAREASKSLIISTPGIFSYGVVEFDSSARICCRFTNDLTRLNQAIDKISSNGCTAIHEGLRLAHELIKEDAAPDRKNTVILLSDGGSESVPALKQADELRKTGVVIYAIGLGQCDQVLMKDIAGDEERFFYADEPAKLKDFFHTVGRKIQNALARDVEITEYPNTASAPFHVFRWGNLRPQDAKGAYHKDKPSVKWFLTGLEEESFMIEYYLSPRCCGWYPVAHERARIDMKNHEDRSFSFQSNQGPYVLVIPRFLGWQYLWIFLNPLFWIIMNRYLGIKCPEAERKIFFKKYEKQAPRPLAPVQILPPIETPYALEINPTLAIGIGYGGISALTHLKRFLWEHNQDDKIAEKVTFAALDSVKPYFSETPRSGTVQLDPSERKNIHVATTQYIRSEARKSTSQREYCWLNAVELDSEGTDYDVGSGTHLNPAIGRLIYLLNRTRLHELKPLVKKLYDTAPQEPVNIYLIGTLGGGTSTGMMLDLCYTIKQILKELNIPQKSINLFLMEAEPDSKETDRERKKEAYDMNKEAFKRELARFFVARDTGFAPLPGDEKTDQWYDHISWVEKKEGTQNQDHLYPQTAFIVYQWITAKAFRDFIMKHSRYTSGSLLTHRFEAHALFFYKRLLEEYFALRLLLTVMGNLILGLEENPGDYSEKSAKIKEEQVTAAIDLLLNKKEWHSTRPVLLLPAGLIKNPDSSSLSRFLSQGGMIGMVEHTAPEEVENYLQTETDAFENLIFTWIDYIMTTPTAETDPQFLEKKLPIVYRSLLKLKVSIIHIKEMAESISPTENLLDRKQCFALSQMGSRFLHILDRWIPILEKWYEILGEGPRDFTGICRKLNDKLNDLEKACEATENLKNPHFKFNKQIKDRLYREYFQDLEREILNQFQWLVDPAVNMKLCIANQEIVKEYEPGIKPDEIDQIINQVMALPGYFASRRYRWHYATIEDFMQMSRETGYDAINDHIRSDLKKTSEHDLLFPDKVSWEALKTDIPTGIAHEKIESVNPLIHGIFKYRLNHEEFKGKDNLDFDLLPPFVFAEEWNIYNALTIYRQLTRKEAQTPSFALVALCRDMKKFLGAIKIGIIDRQIIAGQTGARMIYRFSDLKEVPQSDDSAKDILNLIREITESRENTVMDRLNMGFHEAIQLDSTEIESGIGESTLPLPGVTKIQLYQVFYGAVQYFKHVN